jgi:hypothetical protein
LDGGGVAGVVENPAGELVSWHRKWGLQRSQLSGLSAIAYALVIERPLAHELELRSVIRVTVDLTMIELDGADGLAGWKMRETRSVQSMVTAVLFVFLQPRGDS